MKQRRSRLLVGLALVAVSSSAALAGWHAVVPVTIDVANRRATGSIGSARNSADGVADIACYVDTRVSGVSSPTNGTPTTWGVCTANDANRTYLACSTQRADLIANMRGINGSSLVTFVANSQGYCTQVFVQTASDYEPPR